MEYSTAKRCWQRVCTSIRLCPDTSFHQRLQKALIHTQSIRTKRYTMLSSLILSCYLSNYSSLLLAFFIEISRSVWLSLAVRSCLYTLMNAVVQRAKAITFNYSAKRTSRLPTNCTAQAINGPYKNRFVSPGIRFSFTCIVKDKRAEEIVGDLSC